MLGGLGLIVGLILLLVGAPDHWFGGVSTVGWIVLLIDIVPVAIWIALLAFGVKIVRGGKL